MRDHSQEIVRKLWTYCNVLRDDGLSYSDYVEQLTYLLFLKMADERTKPPFLTLQPLPRDLSWTSLLKKTENEVLVHYENVLRRLGKRTDLFGAIFRKAASRFQDPAKFKRLVHELIDREEWSRYDTDVKGQAYEGLLERSASEGKAGAGQYFTPRPLVQTIVEVMRPTPGITLCDPAAGTGGFLFTVHDFLRREYSLTKIQQDHLNNKALRGIELVDSVARLCVMNLVLHGIGGEESPIVVGDALKTKHGSYDMVLTNPPFGRKSSFTIVNDAGEHQKDTLIVRRNDFWASTSNKQLNFLQHVYTILKQHGRAAVVVPDNVLFESGAGETIRRELLQKCDVHTLLRLPTGIFYAQGVNANVLFFDRRPENEKPGTETLWIYDLRSNKHFTLKENTLKRGDLRDFVKCFNAQNRNKRKESERFKPFAYKELSKRDRVNLDIFWLKDESLEDTENLPAPQVIAKEIAQDLEVALSQFNAIAESLKK
jgi:type I restriction enzyme M protein